MLDLRSQMFVFLLQLRILLMDIHRARGRRRVVHMHLLDRGTRSRTLWVVWDRRPKIRWITYIP